MEELKRCNALALNKMPALNRPASERRLYILKALCCGKCQIFVFNHALQWSSLALLITLKEKAVSGIVSSVFSAPC